MYFYAHTLIHLFYVTVFMLYVSTRLHCYSGTMPDCVLEIPGLNPTLPSTTYSIHHQSRGGSRILEGTVSCVSRSLMTGKL